ncbi:hypothetical protein KXW55_006875 [Aspergillus fumigatus]|nr:hypothetical protein KXV32_004924 [Aspergillus fumigatus]KAH3265089.1 hypothetical protein KXW55_006875 [Aspergillus fumigatus]
MELETDDPQMEAWTMTDIEKACLEFCIELLNQRHRSHEYESALVCAMAVLGQGETGWRDPESYPPILSRVIKIARFMVVQKALWMDPDPWQIIQTWERKDRSVEWVLASADNILGDIDEGYNSDDAIEPRSSPPTSSIHRDDPLPAVDMHRSGRRPFQEQREPAWVEFFAGRTDAVAGPRGPLDDQLAIQQYWQRVAQFKEKLAIVVHVTAGQPARAPELLSIQHTNTVNSRRRNIYIEDGMVTFATAYHKGFHVSNDVKIIHQYVPREVGELVIWYMWLVVPFINQMSAWQASQTTLPTPTIQTTQTAHHAWLWGPDPGTGREWSSERFREALKRETRTRLKNAIYIAAYRNIAIAISRWFLRPSAAFPHNVQQANPAPAEADADAEDGIDIEQ